MFRTLLLTSALLAPAPLYAQATPERAAKIAAEFQRYLPPGTEGLSVKPAGADYLLTFDIGAAFAAAALGDLKIEASPLELHLTDSGDGTYQVRYDQPLSAKITHNNEMRFEEAFQADLAIASLKGGGQYDPALGAFITQDFTYSGLVYSQSMGPAGSLGKVLYRLDSLSGQTSAKANPTGGVDVTFRYEGTGLSEDISMPDPVTGGLTEIKVKAARHAGDGQVSGSRSVAMLDLLAFAVQNLPPDRSPRQQDQLKDKLRTAAPFFNSAEMNGSLLDVTVDTPVGPFRAELLLADIRVSGAVDEGKFVESFSVDGLVLPPGLLPDWASTLAPSKVSLSFGIREFNLAAPLAIFLDRVDFTKGPSGQQEDELLKALLPNGTAALGLSVVTDAPGTYLLDVNGEMKVGPASMPIGSARIELTGIDAILAKVNEAPPEIKQSALPGIAMVRGLGKAEGDKLVYDIEATPEGAVLVNGNDMSALFQ